MSAQQYTIPWSKIAGGGATTPGTGGVYAVRGTIGQPEASAPLISGLYSVTGGFWAGAATVQTPGAPTLKISLTSSNTAMVSWPSPSTGYDLQINTNSLASVNWSNLSSGLQDNGTIKYLIINPPTGNRFYRLFKP